MIQTKITALCLLVVLYFFDMEQYSDSSIYFESMQHNFGQVREDGGPLQHEFLFENRGRDSLRVGNVSAGGGISVLGWTRGPVPPGETGTVTLEFDPRNMPGRFNRVVLVSASGDPSNVTLRLLGEVIPADKTPVDMYPHEIGPLRIRSNHVPLGRVAPGTVSYDTVGVINLTDEELEITFSGVPPHLSFSAEPPKISPGERGVVEVRFDAGMKGEWGTVTDNIRVLVNGKSTGRNILYVSANILEDFSGMTDEERSTAPSIHFDESVYDFGTLLQGVSARHKFRFTNKGQSALLIRSVRSGCGSTATVADRKLIHQGESGNIDVIFDSQGLPGRQSRSIIVITNDPDNQSVVLRITGKVVSE